MVRNRFFLLLIFFHILLSFISCSSKQVTVPIEPQSVILEEDKPVITKKPAEEIISITGVGDIMLGTNFPSEEYLPPDNGETLLSDTTGFFQKSDIVFGNLEGSFLNSGKCYKTCSDPKKCYAFRMPENYIQHLKKAGFNLISIANNHVGDFGLPGREKTAELLIENEINFAGLDTQPSTTFTTNGIKYGFCAFAPNVGTPDLRDIDKACETVRNLSLACDIVIVSFHGGAEGSENRHVTRMDEIFYGENRGNVYEFSHRVIDAGADVVFGHGPHIARAVELYKNRFIAYSLGNFCTYARFNLRGLNGIAPIIKLNVGKDGTFSSGKIIPIIQKYKQGPKHDEDNLAVKEIIELTLIDFPATNLIISETGIIDIKN